jgi:short-subunit dehydrogenase
MIPGAQGSHGNPPSPSSFSPSGGCAGVPTGRQRGPAEPSEVDDASQAGVIAGIASVAGYRGLAAARAYGATKAAQINLLESLRVHLARTGVHVTTICPGLVRTGLTARNPFPRPFILDPGQAARSICDALEHDRTEIVFPAPMTLLMKTARLVPARAWTALRARTSLT